MTWTRRQILGALALQPLVPLIPAVGSHSQTAGRGKRRATLDTARHCIFIRLTGGISQVDTFDLKLGTWTPDILGAQLLKGYVHWPMGIMPRIGNRIDQVSLVRSVSAAELDHGRAVFHMSTSYQPRISNQDTAPHIGSTLSYLLGRDADPGAVLPTSLSFGRAINEGALPYAHRLSRIDAYDGYANLEHAWADAQARFALLGTEGAPAYAADDPRGHYRRTRDQAAAMTLSNALSDLPVWDDPPAFADTRQELYARQAHMAAKLLAMDAGVRFVELNYYGWDHHDNIYADNGVSLVNTCRALDLGLSVLLDALAAQPGTRGGTLLDDTLIVVMGEFGRTPAGLNYSMGRDHYPRVSSVLFAGAGSGGKVLGATNAGAGLITDAGRDSGLPVSYADIHATILSAMGLDPADVLHPGPGVDITPVDPAVNPQPLHELFQEA